MPWRGPRTANDPMLSSKMWAKVKKHWKDRRLPRCQAAKCLLPGIPIDYTPPFTKPTSFNAGHVVPRWKAKALGWTVEQIYSVANTRPEHRKCNVTEGAVMGRLLQGSKHRQFTPPAECSRW